MSIRRNSKPSRQKNQSARNVSSWRQFEELVVRIEAALAPIGAQVRCPDKIPDRITNELREVDASIRYKVGTTPVLIVIECRERTRQQDSLWIEQLATKRDHLGAAKCVAVSSAGFTRPAMRKAEALGIEVRHLRRIDQQTIKDFAPLRTWFFAYKLIHVDPGFTISGEIEFDPVLDRKLNHSLGKRHSLDDEILFSKSSEERTSLAKYIERVVNMSFEGMSEQDRAKLPIGQEWVFRRKRPVALPRKRPLFRCENSRHSGENGQGVRASHGEVFLSFHRFCFLVKH